MPVVLKRMGIGEGVSHPQSTRRSGGHGFGTEPWLKMKMIVVHFVPKKTFLVNSILLNVAKCCVIELVK